MGENEMSAIAYINQTVIPAALGMLPAKMDTPAARAMLLAIGLQESRFEHRRQIGGPARGYYQFERGGGVRGVLNHSATRPIIEQVLTAMTYGTADEISYNAIEHNDILATIYARLLLWTHPRPLPVRAVPEQGWFYYTATWRPGKPHRATWDDFYETAWGMTEGS